MIACSEATASSTSPIKKCWVAKFLNTKPQSRGVCSGAAVVAFMSSFAVTKASSWVLNSAVFASFGPTRGGRGVLRLGVLLNRHRRTAPWPGSLGLPLFGGLRLSLSMAHAPGMADWDESRTAPATIINRDPEGKLLNQKAGHEASDPLIILINAVADRDVDGIRFAEVRGVRRAVYRDGGPEPHEAAKIGIPKPFVHHAACARRSLLWKFRSAGRC